MKTTLPAKLTAEQLERQYRASRPKDEKTRIVILKEISPSAIVDIDAYCETRQISLSEYVKELIVADNHRRSEQMDHLKIEGIIEKMVKLRGSSRNDLMVDMLDCYSKQMFVRAKSKNKKTASKSKAKKAGRS